MTTHEIQKTIRIIRRKANEDFLDLTSGKIDLNKYANKGLVELENAVDDLREAINEALFVRK